MELPYSYVLYKINEACHLAQQILPVVYLMIL